MIGDKTKRAERKKTLSAITTYIHVNKKQRDTLNLLVWLKGRLQKHFSEYFFQSFSMSCCWPKDIWVINQPKSTAVLMSDLLSVLCEYNFVTVQKR